MNAEPALPRVLHPQSPAYRRRRRRRFIATILLALIVASGSYFLFTYRSPTAPTEIYRGITYSCQRLREGPESGGLFYLVRADLNVPGVSIYITPLDSDALAHGQEYRLKYVSTAVRENHLAAAVNGTYFSSDSYWIRLPGDFARSTETIVSDHVVNHIDPNTYLNWWDDDSIAHHEHKPPTSEALANAKWAIGTQGPWLNDFKVSDWAGPQPDRRTMIGFDSAKRLVWIAVFDRASVHFASETLAKLGVPDAFAIDGGTSSTMALGAEARGVRPGTVTGGWRPVAVQFGFRADPFAKN
jgi:hypothetical protein